MKQGICLLLFIVAATGYCYGQVLPIADVKEIDSSGSPIYMQTGEEVTVTGVVTVESGIFEGTKLDIYIQDETAGINVSLKSPGPFRVVRGDSIVVTGKISQGISSGAWGNTYLLVSNLEDITVVGKGTVPRPLVLTAEVMTSNSAPPLELYEGMLIRLEDVTIDPAEWPVDPGATKTVKAQDPTASFEITIDRDTDIGGTQPPPSPFIVIGVVVQDDFRFPYLSGYKLWPRARFEDFLKIGNGCGLAVLEPSVVENEMESFDLTVTLTGNSRDTITAFSIDLPLEEGWGWWDGDRVDLSGPGVAGAVYEITDQGVVVRSSSIFNDGDWGAVTFSNVSPPAGLASSEVLVETSVDGTDFSPIALFPVLKAVYPVPPLVVNEIYPDDGTTPGSNAFIEIFNSGEVTAYLDGFALCEQRAVSYCATGVRHVFTSDDTITPRTYMVIAESVTGFTERFGFAPDIEAGISPLGRVGGDGGVCGDSQTYEVVSLWRDQSLTDMVNHLGYRDSISCPTDICEGSEVLSAVFTRIPPKGYALIVVPGTSGYSQVALSAVPTPGAENQLGSMSPVIEEVRSHTQNVVEVVFSEPILDQDLKNTSNFSIDGNAAISGFTSLSQEKVLLLCEDLEPGADATIAVSGVRNWFGDVIVDTLAGFEVSYTACTNVCRIQEYDSKGYSPLNGENVYMAGFITVPPGVFQPEYQSIYVQGLDGCGVNVFSYNVSSPVPRLGDLVMIQGEVEEYVSGTAGSVTEIYMASESNLTILSTGYPEPPALVLKTGEIGNEANEGRLIETEGAVISATEINFYIDDGTGGIQIYQNYTPIDFTRFKPGMYVKIKGVILQYDYTLPFLEGYELVPRYESDIEIIENAFPSDALLMVNTRVFCPSCGEEGFRITFGGHSLSHLTLRIFDASGRLVSTLYDGSSVGETEVLWNGRGGDGRPVSPGLYICFLEVVEAGSGTRTTESAPIVVGVKLN